MSRITSITLGKEFKMGLPNFSNVTASAYITWEIKEGEEFKFDPAWDLINQQISRQTDLDQSWIKRNETKNYFKTTIAVKKGVNNEGDNRLI
jgi:hypothetical protein